MDKKSPVNNSAELNDNKSTPPTFQPSDEAMLSPPIIFLGHTTELHHPRSGPCTVMQALSIKVDTTRPTTVYFNRLKLFTVHRAAPAPTRSPGPSTEILGDGDEVVVPAHGGLALRIGHH